MTLKKPTSLGGYMHKSTLLACVVIFAACKLSQKPSSKIRSVDDGGCSEYETKLEALIAKRNSYNQNTDANPTDASGMALNDKSSNSTIVPTPSPSPKPASNNSPGPINDVDSYSSNSTSSSQSKPVQSYIAELNEQIIQTQDELQRCEEKKLGTSSVQKDPKDGNAGHCNFNGQDYDILNYNCHSAANESVRNDPTNTGIISCAGMAPVNGSPAYHTFNYRREGNTIVYYNWGQTCKAPLKTFPPDINDPDHYVCAKAFCGEQFNDKETQPLKPGQAVEEPGPKFCAADKKDKKTCDSCCQERGKFWDREDDSVRPTDRTFTQFMSQCYQACAQTFNK